MGKFQEASDNIKKLAVMFKGLVDLSEEMDKVDSLENYSKELQAKIDSMNDEKALISNELLGLDSQKFSLIKDIEDLGNKKENLLRDLEYQKVTEKQMLQAELDAMKLDAEKELEDVKARKASDLAQINSTADMLQKEIEEKTAKLQEVTSALEKIKGGI